MQKTSANLSMLTFLAAILNLKPYQGGCPRNAFFPSPSGRGAFRTASKVRVDGAVKVGMLRNLDFGQIFDRRISARNVASPLAISFPELKKEKAVGLL
jgi:hypothetical protein